MKTLIVVPAYNESRSIIKVLRGLKKNGYKNIVVIDDGSTDKTGPLAQKEVENVLRHVINRGLGAALGTGLAYAKTSGADTVVTFDSDGQHDARDIKRLLAPIRAGRADVVIGSRMLGQQAGMPMNRKLLNYLSNLATFCLYGCWATDTLSGLRAFNRRAVSAIKLKTDRMEVSNEFFREIRAHKLRLSEIPIKPIYTDYSLKSSSQGEFASLQIALKMVLRLFR